MNTSRPAASFDVSYSTYEDACQEKLPENLVDLLIEDFVKVEVGAWGTKIKIVIKAGAKVETNINEAGVTTIYLIPPKDAKTSIMKQGQLTDVVTSLFRHAHER